MPQSVVRYENSPVFINYEEQELRNIQNSHSDVRFQYYSSALDQAGVTITQDLPQILDTQIMVIQQSCESIATNNK